MGRAPGFLKNNWRHDTKHNDVQLNGNQLCLMPLFFNVAMLSVVLLNVIMLIVVGPNNELRVAIANIDKSLLHPGAYTIKRFTAVIDVVS